jgi:hypothetical protein
MPITKRFNELQGLANIDVFFDERGLDSEFFNISEFPEPLQVGKNSFLIAGSERLKNFTELQIDIVDSAGNSIYHEPVREYLEGNMRRISIEVYDTNAPGPGFLYIVGEADPNVVDITDEWNGIYNVRYTRPISINTTQVNTQPIFFYKQPKVRAREITKAFIEELPPSASYSITGSVTVTATTPGDPINPREFDDDLDDKNPAVTFTGEDRPGKFLDTFKNKRENKRISINQPTVLALGRVSRRASPETPTHTITIQGLESSPENVQDKLTSAFVGGKIKIESPQVDETTYFIGSNTRITKPSTYVTRIQEVLNSTTIIPETPFVVEVHPTPQGGNKTGFKDPNFNDWEVWSSTSPTGKTIESLTPRDVTPPQPDTPYTDETGATWLWGEVTDPSRIPREEEAGGNANIEYYGWNESGSVNQAAADTAIRRETVSMLPNNNVTMSIIPTPEKKLTSTYLRSYADFSIINMRTFSGDIFRVKIYGKIRGALTDFELLYDSPIESPEILIDPFSVDGFTNVGYFYTGSVISDYWASSSNSVINQNDDYLVDGVLMSGSNYEVDEEVEFFTTASYQLERNISYAVGFDSYYIKQPKKVTVTTGGSESTKIIDRAELKVFLSGSRAKDGTGDIGEDIYLGKVSIPDGPATDEGEQKGVYQIFKSAPKHFPSAQLKFVATAGQWVIKDVSIKPTEETNFSPDYFRTIVPLPFIHKRPAQMDFLVEFYDVDGKIADSFGFLENFRIVGAPQVIQGDNNLLSGSMYLGNLQGQGIEIHGGSAYLRSIGYEGFEATISSGSGGFMIFSGSLSGSRADGTQLLHTTESYEGVGLEMVDAHGSVDRYLRFRTNPSIFEVVTDTFFLGSSTQFLSGSNQQIEISSSNFHLQPDGDVVMQGTITAEAGGTIGGWTVDSNFISAPLTDHTETATSRVYLSTANDNTKNIQQGLHIYRDDDDTSAGEVKVIRVGGLSDLTNLHATGSPQDYGIQVIRNKTASTYENIVYIGKQEQTISGFSLSPTALSKSNLFQLSSSTNTADPVSFISSSAFKVSAGGNVTGSDVLFTGGRIANWDITGDTLSSVNASNKGIILDADNSTPIIEIREDDNNRVQIYHTTSTNWGLKGISSGDTIFRLGDTNRIAGFTFTNNTMSSSNLLINADDGEIRTGNFVTGTTGWRISAGTFGGVNANGTAEFENARIRGTLRTAVFEKETVNAVGGQLWVANSTALSGSASATDTELFCDNVSGFVKDEIIFAKKVDGAGFTKEFMKVFSQSRSDVDSDNDFSGILHVTRSFGGTATGSAFSVVTTITEPITTKSETELTVADESPSGLDLIHSTIRIDSEIMQVTGSVTNKLQVVRGTNGTAKATHSDNSNIEKVDPDVAFLMGLVSPAESYKAGQVLVSTGRYLSGTGATSAGTGYMLLNANPGDATTPYMDFHERTGSGIYDTKLKTRIGDLSGLVNTAIGDELFKGSSNPGFGMVSENIFLKGAITATSGSIGGLEMTPDKIFVGGIGTYNDSSTAFFVGDDGKFSLKNKISWDGSSTLTMNPTNLSITTTGGNDIKIDSTGTPQIALGATLPTAYNSGTGFFVDGTGKFLAGNSGGNKIQFDGSTLTVAGTINILSGDLAGVDATSISGSGNQTSASLASETAGLLEGSSSMQTQVVLNSNGMDLKSSGGTTLASYGADITIGQDANDQSRIFIDSDSVDLIVDTGGTDVTEASFGATTTIGGTSGQHVSIDSDSFDVKTNSSTTVASFGAETIIGNSSNENVKITNSTMEFRDSTTVHGSMTAGTWTLGQDTNNTTRLELESGQVSFINKLNNNDTSSLVMKADGTIEGVDYLIEKTRLFGSGGMGSIIIHQHFPTASVGPNGISGNIDSGHVYSDAGTTANIDRVIHKHTDNRFYMLQDGYFNDLTIDGNATLYPNGHRLYVSGTLTVGTSGGSKGYIYRLGNSGGNASGTSPGAGGATTTVFNPLSTSTGTLRGGGAGGTGGTGHNASGEEDGGGGGGGGSGGGIIFIAARKIINTHGYINVNGGNGGNGAQGVGE